MEGSITSCRVPRRFGKSLFVNTLKELFEGNEPLFRGLDVHGTWGWSVQHPVIRLSFGYGHFHDPGYVHMHVLEQLADIAEAAGVESPHETGPGRLADLIRRLHRRSGHGVVVLVDEYDKPILDALEEPEVARANRDFLRGLYAVFKECDEEIRFTFITGVSKFSKSSLFSGLNNLEDITLDPLYSGICGYTEADLDEVFAPEMPGLDREEIRRWYNGYSWLGGECVYDPIDILLLLKKRVFKPYWVDTGTPKFLPELLFRRRVSSLDLERMAGDEELLSKFDVGEIGTEALLFQTGYLTITGKERSGWRTRYRLGYPNLEVRLALNARLLSEMVPEESWRVADHAKLGNLLAAGDLAGLKAKLRAVFASIPSDWHRRNQIASMRGSRRRSWTWWRRTAAAAGGRIWWCGTRTRCTCSSSRWQRRHDKGRRWPRSRQGATQRSISARGDRSTWWEWSSAARAATWRGSIPSASNDGLPATGCCVRTKLNDGLSEERRCRSVCGTGNLGAKLRHLPRHGVSD